MEDNHIFSKEMRDRMKKFDKLTPREALASPAFFNALLEHAGFSEERKKALWNKVGRPDCYRSDAVFTEEDLNKEKE